MTAPAAMMVDWAAPTLTERGCVLHALDGGGWDVELPDGSWRAAGDARELVKVAHEVAATHRKHEAFCALHHAHDGACHDGRL